MLVAAAIADPVRRDIVLLLRQGPLSAGEIAAHFTISRPAISRHLRVLRASGLAKAELCGRQRIYRLDLDALAPLHSWLALVHDDWSHRLDALETEVHRTRRDRRAQPSQIDRRSA